jgi:hypothetical protein
MKNSFASEPSQPNSTLDNAKRYGCDKKRFYDTYWEASHAAAVSREFSGHYNIEPYHCLFCPMFHIGHRRNQNKRGVIGPKVHCGVCYHWVKNKQFEGHIKWHEQGGMPSEMGDRLRRHLATTHKQLVEHDKHSHQQQKVDERTTNLGS